VRRSMAGHPHSMLRPNLQLRRTKLLLLHQAAQAGDMRRRALQRVSYGAHRLRLRRDVRPVHSGGRSVSLLSAADSCSRACGQVRVH
jgi:hypothetical protein